MRLNRHPPQTKPTNQPNRFLRIPLFLHHSVHIGLRRKGEEKEGKKEEGGIGLPPDYFLVLALEIFGTVGGFWNYYRRNQQGVNIAMASSS